MEYMDGGCVTKILQHHKKYPLTEPQIKWIVYCVSSLLVFFIFLLFLFLFLLKCVHV